MASPAKLREALRTLTEHGVEHIVVVGVAAVLAGAPISTFDLDLVYQRSRENVRKLVAALAQPPLRPRRPRGPGAGAGGGH